MWMLACEFISFQCYNMVSAKGISMGEENLWAGEAWVGEEASLARAREGSDPNYALLAQ
jgi:hypothetical protein